MEPGVLNRQVEALKPNDLDFIKPGMLKHLYLKCLMCLERLTTALHRHYFTSEEMFALQVKQL